MDARVGDTVDVLFERRRPRCRPDRRPLAVADAGARRRADADLDRHDSRRVRLTRRRRQLLVRRSRRARGSAAAPHGARHVDRPPAIFATVAPDDAARELVVVAFDDNRLIQELFGEFDQNLAVLEQQLGVEAVARGNQVTLRGDAEALARARLALDLALRAPPGRPDTSPPATSRARSAWRPPPTRR